MHVATTDKDDETTPQYILVLLDGFSKFVELVPCVKEDSATVVKALLDWFKRYGVVRQWVSDQGSHFLNTVMTDLKHKLQAEHHFTVVYAPKSNGQVERVNREIKEKATALLLDWKLPAKSWPEVVAIVNFILNNTPSKRLGGYAPIEVFMGHERSSPLDVIFMPEANEIRRIPWDEADLKKRVEDLQDVLAELHHKAGSVAERKKHPRPGEVEVDFGVGDYVLTSTQSAEKNCIRDGKALRKSKRKSTHCVTR